MEQPEAVKVAAVAKVEAALGGAAKAAPVANAREVGMEAREVGVVARVADTEARAVETQAAPSSFNVDAGTFLKTAPA